MGAPQLPAQALTPAPSPRGRGEQGYSLVVLVVAVTVLNILVAAMLPLWSTAIRREKEEELIFRGFQYAEAIRVFRQRYQRYPNRLEELLEVERRCIRQLWKDPMTEDGKWALIFENQPQHLQVPPQGGNQGQGSSRRRPPDKNGRGDDGDGDSGPQLGVKKGQEVQIGPIIGVRSKSGEKAMILLFGRERYDEWDFTETRLRGNTQPRNEGGVGVPPPPGGLMFSTRWLGRPMHGVDQQPATGLPQNGNLPNGQGPGLDGPRSSRPRQAQPGGTSRPRGLP